MTDQNPSSAPPEPFGDRLVRLLAEADMNKASLADIIGAERSTVTRWTSNETTPSAANLQKIAAVLEMEIVDLVGGSTAASRLKELRKVVPSQQHAASIRQLAECRRELQKMIEQLDQEVARRQDAERHLSELFGELDRARSDSRALQQSQRRTEGELHRANARREALNEQLEDYEEALTQAATLIAELQNQLEDLAAGVHAAEKSSRTASILAGIAAGGVVTVASLLALARRERGTPPSDDEGFDEEEEE